MRYNFSMFSQQTIREFPLKALGRAWSSLGSAIPMGILLELARSGNTKMLRETADELVLRGSCRLRKLQSAIPQIKIPESLNKLLTSIKQCRLFQKGTTTKLEAGDELDLAQAFIELYVGMLLRLLTSQKEAARHGVKIAKLSIRSPRVWVLSLNTPKRGTRPKRPIPIPIF